MPNLINEEVFEKLNLTGVISDLTLSIHKNVILWSTDDACYARIVIVNLREVYVSRKAKPVLDRCYLKAEMLLNNYAKHVKANLMCKVTQGRWKGNTVINSEANWYRHITEESMDLMVYGLSACHEGKLIRQVRIVCCEKLPAATPSAGVSA